MSGERAAYETPDPDETPAPQRIAALMQRVWRLAGEQPGLFAQAELAIAAIVRRAPNAELRADAALAAVMDELGSDTAAILGQMSDTGCIVTVVCCRDLARFIGGLGCHHLSDPPSAFAHQHVGKLVLELGSLAYWSAVKAARARRGEQHQGWDENWIHSAKAGKTLTLVVSARRGRG